MPLEIRELHIRAVIDEPAAEGNGTAVPTAGTVKANEEEEGLIARIVEVIMDLLEEKKER